MILYRKNITGHLPGEFHKFDGRDFDILIGTGQTPQEAYNEFDRGLSNFFTSCGYEGGLDKDPPAEWVIQWKELPELKPKEDYFSVIAKLTCYKKES